MNQCPRYREDKEQKMIKKYDNESSDEPTCRCHQKLRTKRKWKRKSFVTDGKTWSMNSLLYGRKLYYDR